MKYSHWLILFFVGNYNLFAESNYKLDYLTPADGLPQTFVFCIYQDSKGFLWFGMRNGLCRYDGYKFVTYHYDPFDSNSLSGTAITAISEDSKGNLWIGTQISGLNYIDRKSGSITRFRRDPGNPNSIGSNEIRALVISESDELWILPHEGKIYNYRTGKANFNAPEVFGEYEKSIDDFQQWAGLTIDKSGNLYLLAYTKKWIILVHFDNTKKKFRLIQQFDREKVLYIYNFSNKNNSNLYINVEYKDNYKKIFEIDGNDGSIIKTIDFDDRISTRIYNTKLVFDNQNNLWLYISKIKNKLNSTSEDYSGLYKLGDINKIKKISPINMIFSSNEKTFDLLDNILIEDNQANIWTRTYKGVVKLTPISPGISNFIHNPDENSITNNFIRSIFVDKAGTTYIGTNNGLNILSRGKSKWENVFLEKEKGNFENQINVIYEDEDSKILIGTNNGVFIYDPVTGKINEFDNRVLDRDSGIWSLYRDKQHNLWIGTFYGLLILDKNNNIIRRFNADSKKQIFERNTNWFIYEDKKGNIWIGTEKGLLKWLPLEKKFLRYQHDDKNSKSICGNNIWSITEDKKGNLWVGAYGAGLSMYDYKTGKFSSITKKDGLPDNGIASILCDDSNNLWIGTDKGLVMYDQEKKNFMIYNTDDGFVNDEYTFHAYFKCSDGSMLFGGLKGFSRFYPDSMSQDKYIPDIVITSFKINSEEIQYELSDGDTVNIDWDNKYFSFEYAVLDFRNSKQNKYAYKLENLDEEWIFTGTDRFASFSNLDPGLYKFRVKGCNSHGVWNEKGILIYVNIDPPYYMTMWFKTLIFVMIGGAFAFIIITRSRSRKRKELTKRRLLVSQLKALQSQMNPHFIFNSLNAILNLILRKDNELSMQYLTKFSRLLREILENSRSLSVPLSREIEYLKIYLDLESLRFENKFKYKIEVDKNIDPDQYQVPTLLIQPYIENSIRHGITQRLNNGMIDINFSLNDDYLICDIIDNGIGRQKSGELKAKSAYLHKSLGMEVNKDRLDLLNSKVEIIDLQDDYGEPSGTQIKLMLNLKTGLIDE